MTLTATTPRPRPTLPRSGWDCEVVVLRGNDRADLRARALALAGFIERTPDIALPNLAATLAATLAPGGARLGLVASSPADLLTKLRRAADRIADPKCKQVRDSGGVYFFDQPLAAQGTVALLFPGEGAQYLDMLADLCGAFPEVEETFAWCDQLAAEAGRPEDSLRKTLHLSPDVTPAERTAAEAELRKLGASIFGVLIADQAIYRVLENLRIPVAAMAGHSAGELAALLLSGAMRSQEQHGPRLVEIMEIMQRQEDEAGGPDVALLAVGAGRKAVEEVAAAAAGGAVVVAMDNCPHQCVAVGPTHLVAVVESALHERGVISERLPFRRPYHTPLFEPWMQPFRELFAGVPFGPPHTPVYCCSTGKPFPADPDVARDLVVNHWVHPVEFTRMIETMHADGVRVFVEAGPRGNLSAFVEDILRGKPFAAIPANLPRKSGPAQINHLVAQLVAHHVPLDLGHLYAHRDTRVVEWETGPSANRGQEPVAASPDSPTDLAGHPPKPVAEPPSPISETPSSTVREEVALSPEVPLPVLSNDATAVMNGYLTAMEQFLDVQREVMEAFLGLVQREVTTGEPATSVAGYVSTHPATDVAGSPMTAPPGYCLMGPIERFVPGQELIFRRVMDVQEDLYADEHTLGGRCVSRDNPGQNGLPVLPMTFSLEAMAEAASALAPGKVVVAIRDIRLSRWLPFDPEPTTLEVRATVVSTDPETGIVRVKADVRDLGNSFLRDGAKKPACEATVLLADHYPSPPAPHPFRLTDELPCRATVADLRRNMFHGPIFQMIRSLDRYGREGVEGTLEVQPRDGWFRSNPHPQSVIDPVLIDAAMHLIGAWHLEQPDWSGRILLPIGVGIVEFFGPIPAVGGRLVVRGHNEAETARQARHGLELFDPDGRLWLRMTGAAYWRFYLPYGHVNFFGPKDEYFLSRDWPDAVPPRAAGALPRRCHSLEPPPDLKQPVLRAAGARVTMTPRELAEFAAHPGPDSARDDWFYTRLMAKDAVRAAWIEKHDEAIFPADLETQMVDGGRMVVRPRGRPKAEPLPPVAVALVDGTFAAFAAFTEAVGIGLVGLPKNASPEAEREARSRAVCLAVADALRIEPGAVILQALDPANGSAAVILAPGVSVHYPDLKEHLRVQTARQKNVVVATAMYEAVAGCSGNFRPV